MTTISDIEEKSAQVLDQVVSGMPYIEQVVRFWFPNGPMFAIAMEIIGRSLLPGLAKTLHELSQASAKQDKITPDDVVRGGLLLAQHNDSSFPNVALLQPKGSTK
jgi:hypothetical protein